MMKPLAFFSFLLLFSMATGAQELVLKKGITITKSVKIKKQVYRLAGEAELRPLIIIEGENLVVDFNNAQLTGSRDDQEPDQFTGLAVLVRNGKNITIRNLKARGYKIALMAENVESLTISHSDLSYNYRPRLNSGRLKEDISDWMSYHQNEKDEWLQYGAAIYLKDCLMPIIHDNRVTGGQNALMMTRCNIGLIYNNDFSFNSGLGIAFYRSSNNRVMYNKINFNVRGYSHGFYNRGQDSAAILVYEQSNKNLFFKNSATHSGDGFFLWAGQSTMDSGKGGCNDNALVENDFSYAPTNGIEVTFSRNYIYKNRIFECDHGIWGGYSYNTRISNNQFRNNRIAIAIEHGQENTIDFNLFMNDREGIRLWARQQEPEDWGYARHRDTRSRDYVIASNSFNNIPLVYNFSRSQNLLILDNTYSGSQEIFKVDSLVSGIDSIPDADLNAKLEIDSVIFMPTIEKPMDVFRGSAALAGRKNIRMTEWGPHDYRSPLLWHTNPADTTRLMKFEVIGGNGKWKLKTSRGVSSFSKTSGSLPDSFTVMKNISDRQDIFIELEYTGMEVTSPVGKKTAAGKPYLFHYSSFFQPIPFQVRWYAVDTAMHHPIKTNQLFPPNARLRPVKEERTTQLQYAWWGGIKTPESNYPQFITIAEGEGNFIPGNYEIGVTWDDAVRVYIDNKLVLDEWEPGRYKFDQSPHKKLRLPLGGKHQFRVEHLELGGFATLSLKIKPVK